MSLEGQHVNSIVAWSAEEPEGIFDILGCAGFV